MVARKTGVETSKKIATLASKGLRAPSTLTTKQIKQLAGAALANRQGPTVPKESWQNDRQKIGEKAVGLTMKELPNLPTPLFFTVISTNNPGTTMFVNVAHVMKIEIEAATRQHGSITLSDGQVSSLEQMRPIG